MTDKFDPKKAWAELQADPEAVALVKAAHEAELKGIPVLATMNFLTTVPLMAYSMGLDLRAAKVAARALLLLPDNPEEASRGLMTKELLAVVLEEYGSKA